jgi:hypothetical protein
MKLLKIHEMRIILLISLLGFLQNTQKQIHVKIVVEASDTNIKNKIQSKFNTELRSKTGVILTSDSPTFIITVSTAEIKDQNHTVGISMSTVLTKRVITNDNKTTYAILINVVNSIALKDIESKSSEIVSRFDVDYFEKER